MRYCSCGAVIPKERIDAITLNGRFPLPSAVKCVSCAQESVKKKAGYMPSTSKMMGEIIIADQETVQAFHKDAWRAGTGVSRGMKS